VWLDLHERDEFFADFAGVVRGLRDHEPILLLVDEHVVRQKVLDDISDVLNGIHISNAPLYDGVAQVQMLLLFDSL